MVKAALALHEATGAPEYLARASQWQRALDRHYIRPDTGGYYLTADDAEGLIVRPDSTIDEATPNPNGVTAQNLIRLAVLTGDETWRQQADVLLDACRLPRHKACISMRAWQTPRLAFARDRSRRHRSTG
jgi:uncharacterized protein YyaL (SSP411 family)